MNTRAKALFALGIVAFLVGGPLAFSYVAPGVTSGDLLAGLTPLLLPLSPVALLIPAVVLVDALARRRSPLWGVAALTWPGVIFYLGALALRGRQTA